MSNAFLLQNTANSVVVFLQDRFLGIGKERLTSTDVVCQLKKSSDSLFVIKNLAPTTNATAQIGSGPDGTVIVAVPGAVGNTYTIQVYLPVGTSSLNVTVAGPVISVYLAVNAGIAISAQNTALLIAQAITNASDLVTASASGTGASSLTGAQGPVALSGGLDGDLVELGGGYYRVALSTADTSVLGNLFIRFDGPLIAGMVDTATVASNTPATPPVLPSIPTTVITGTILTLDGLPQANACVQARTLTVPAIFDGVAITNELLVVKTDSNGFFTLNLITGSKVDVAIPSAGYRRTITVPASSTNIFDIP